MQNLELSRDFYAKPSETGFGSGEIYHIERNEAGGSLSTPVARYFVTNPAIPAEGYFPHQRLDCFFGQISFVSDPRQLTKRLFGSLQKLGVINEPAWIGWHVSEELAGMPLGEVWDFD